MTFYFFHMVYLIEALFEGVFEEISGFWGGFVDCRVALFLSLKSPKAMLALSTPLTLDLRTLPLFLFSDPKAKAYAQKNRVKAI